jgi:hypothetical protein
MSIQIITTLISSVLGVIVGAVANYLLTKKKVNAEIKKLEAETEKTRIEAVKLSNELDDKYKLETSLNRTNKDEKRSSDINIFWQAMLGEQTNRKIYVILSAKNGFEWVQGLPTPQPGHTALLSYNEVISFLKLQDSLEQIKEKAILVHGGIEDTQSKKIYIPEFLEDETLIIIGSPNAHKFCRRILSSPKLAQIPFRFGVNEKGKCINCYQDETGKWSDKPIISFPSESENGSDQDDIEEDFGIILRMDNPRDASNNNKILIMGGNHGLGTESAVKFVTDKDRIKLLNEFVKGQDFEAIFQASVNKNKGLGLGIRKLVVLNNGIWIPVKIT